MRLPGRGRDMFEVPVVVKHDRAMMLGDGRGQQIDDAGRAMVATRRHPNLDLAGAIGDAFVDRERYVETLTASRDGLHFGTPAARVAKPPG